ncbi:MAG: beta-ribofuranosylaminobenzene 5'-phosphate synthase family protein [Pseudomonadota bacterium]
MRLPRHSAVRVTVPARLHLGFLDLEGGLGRRYGSLGITLDGPSTRLYLRPAAGPSTSGPDCERAQAYLLRLVEDFGLNEDLELTIEQAIPAHAGLGSGTQLALAVGHAVERLFALGLSATELANRLDRGARSGIGLGAFTQGGVLLDGGRGALDEPPPIISRFDFPNDWRIFLIYDHSNLGVHGPAELEAFQALPPFPAEAAAGLCRLVLMMILPALAERDLGRFGAGISELQRVVGDHFAPAQGGRFASPGVSEVLTWLEAEGTVGIGQSSWGPTGFALCSSEQVGLQRLEQALARWPDTSGLRFDLHRGRNRGAESEVTEAVRAAP